LISEDETKIVSYMTKLQFIGFRISVTDVIRYAFYIAKNTGKEKKSFNNVFLALTHNPRCKHSQTLILTVLLFISDSKFPLYIYIYIYIYIKVELNL
jgi:hypothetical protein